MRRSPKDVWLVRAAVFALSLTCAAAASAQTQSPDAANRALAASFIEVWNGHDMAPLARLLTADADWVNVDAGHGKGRDLIVERHQMVHSGPVFKDSVMSIKDVAVAMIKPDVAVVHVTWALRGDRDPDGTPRQPREGVFTWITVNDGGAWRIRASHNTNRRAAPTR